jgi:L-alanine-DL-glutamate epimerase-like enolase superfamily enzyme
MAQPPTIDRVEAGLYLIPLPEVLTDSTHGEMRGFEIVTARVFDSDGAEGCGYTYTVGRNGGAIHDILAREIAELTRGEDPSRIEHLWEKLWWALHYGGRGGPMVLALSAFDIALWDLKARRAGEPLWRHLGGYDAQVPCYAGGIDLMLSADELIAQTEGNLGRGFRAIKMKVGRDNLAEDVAKVAAMRAHLGDGFPLLLDANMKYTADQAIRAARAFAPYDPVWLEEPITPEDIPGHVRVVREGGLPVAAGENLRSLWEFRNYIAAGAVTYPEPDATNCGGVTAFMKIARLAEAFNLPVTSHGAHDITVHLLAACPNRSYLEAHGFGLDSFIAHPLEIIAGNAVAPDRPGHGLAFDWQALEAVRQR